jgi:hypothetical protein
MQNSQAQNHELMHPVGKESAWSESYYFNFVDPVTKLAMFTRVGFRPQDGWADALHVVYLEGQRIAFTYGRRNIEPDLSRYDGDLKAGDLTIACEQPFKKWQISYSGQAQDIPDGAILLERRKLRPEGWYAPATLDMQVQFECITEPHHSRSDDAETSAFGHFEQSGRVSGVIKLGDQSWDVSGFGVRDKSWGPRDWGAGQRSASSESARVFSTSTEPAPFVNWFSMNFGDKAAMGGSGFRHQDGVIRGSGWIQRDGDSMQLNNIVITTGYAPNSILHRVVTLEGEIEGGEAIRMTGRVLSVCPTKVPMPGGATFINEGLVEYTWGDSIGYGIAEHWHAVSMG